MRFKLTSATKFAALAILAASAAPAFAQSAGSVIASAGWFHVAPQDSSTPLNITSPSFIAGPVAGSGASVGSVDTLGLSLSYFFTDNWAASFDFGIPPKYKLKGTGTLSQVGTIGTAKQYAPALVGKYYFGGANTQFRPFLGLGVTRVSYKSIELTDSFQNFGRTAFGDPTANTTASLSSAWRPVYTGGLSYAITKDLYASFSVSYIRLKTTGNLTTTTNTVGTVQSNTTLTLNPIVTYLNIGYRF